MSVVEFESTRSGVSRPDTTRSPTEGAHHEINREAIGTSPGMAALGLSLARIADETKLAGTQLDGEGGRSYVVLTLPQIKEDESRMGDWTKPQHRRDQERYGVNHSQLMAINDAKNSATRAGARHASTRESDADLHNEQMRKITHQTMRKEIDAKVRAAMVELGHRLPS